MERLVQGPAWYFDVEVSVTHSVREGVSEGLTAVVERTAETGSGGSHGQLNMKVGLTFCHDPWSGGPQHNLYDDGFNP